MPSQLERSVASHYGLPGLEQAIFGGIAAAGIDLDALTPESLAPVDEFHTAGRLTTKKALELMPLEGGMHVLDAGCGIGGTARCLAKEHDCRVTGLDLTAEYVDLACKLTEKMALSATCSFRQGSVLDMPFEDNAFDAAVSFHVAMNIVDRAAFYRELARVLRPGGTVCFFDVMKGPTPGMRYPVPWAETESTSFLKSTNETRELLRAQGFTIVVENNLRDFSMEYFRKIFSNADGPPPLGLHLLTGPNAPEKFENYAKALNEHQIEPVVMVAKAP